MLTCIIHAVSFPPPQYLPTLRDDRIADADRHLVLDLLPLMLTQVIDTKEDENCLARMIQITPAFLGKEALICFSSNDNIFTDLYRNGQNCAHANI